MTLVNKNIVGDFRPVGTSGFIFAAINPTGNRTRWVPNLESSNIAPIDLGTFVYGDESRLVISPSAILIGSSWSNPEFTFNDRNIRSRVLSLRVESAVGNNSGVQITTGNPVELAAAENYFVGTGSVSNPAIGQTVGGFNITGSGEYEVSSILQGAIKYYQIAYWGTSTQPTGYTQNFIKTLANSGLAFIYPNDVLQFNLGANEYGWYAHRDSSTGLIFTDQASQLAGGWSVVATGVPFNNGTSYDDTFDIYRTDNPGLGNLKVKITT